MAGEGGGAGSVFIKYAFITIIVIIILFFIVNFLLPMLGGGGGGGDNGLNVNVELDDTGGD
ncbi:hypothetical protein [Alkalicoccus urumqiensis]|uniref:Uncharacterized protein n=1 Tax=Alkalicoccus urumqiensis TaxID=1548213 RepID=A0A2P6MK27_ALKUR|nr:hypothetical protein [Alkalicoccus urumqiensis]PRO66613.1 hypothetical protein C6I21_04520 [Alkalicoccus urumqiensis]